MVDWNFLEASYPLRKSAVGLPFIKEKDYGGDKYSITEYTMSEIVASVYEKIEQTGIKEGILFIDEINCVSETLAPTMLQFLQCKTFGTHKIPDGYIICAAGNPPQYNKAVREFDIATLDRVRLINVEPDINAWMSYAENKRVHPSITSYLSAKREEFHITEKTALGIEFVTPRAWDELSELITAYEELSVPITEEITGEYIKHNAANKRFFAFYSLFDKYRKDFDIFAIVSGKTKKSDKLSKSAFDERLVLINMIADFLEKRFEKYVREDVYTDMLFAFLKELKQDQSNIPKILKEKEISLKREIHALTKGSTSINVNVYSKIRLCKEISVIIENNEYDFSEIRKGFDERTEKRKNFVSETLSYIDNVYRFLENTFDSLREIVILTTKFAASKNAFRFLSENKSEKYHRYNKELLFDNRQKELTSQIENYRLELNKIASKGAF